MVLVLPKLSWVKQILRRDSVSIFEVMSRNVVANVLRNDVRQNEDTLSGNFVRLVNLVHAQVGINEDTGCLGTNISEVCVAESEFSISGDLRKSRSIAVHQVMHCDNPRYGKLARPKILYRENPCIASALHNRFRD